VANPVSYAEALIAPGMWASSNCSLVRASTSSAPSAIPPSTARGARGVGVPIDSISGPLLMATICSTFGGGSPRVETASSTNSSSVWKRTARLGERSTPSVGGWRGLVQGAEDPCGALALLDREIRAGHVADEERVAGQHRPGVALTSRVAEQEGGVFGTVAGRMHRPDLHIAEGELPAVGERLVRVLGVGKLVDVDRGPGRSGEPAVPGDVIGMVGGLGDGLAPPAIQGVRPNGRGDG